MSAPRETCVPTLHSNKHLTKLDYGSPGPKQHVPLQELPRPHVDSFNWMLKDGLALAAKAIKPIEFELKNGARLSLNIETAWISSPTIAPGNTTASTLKVFPSECRARATTYRGRLQAVFTWKLNGITHDTINTSLGEVPIMVKSNACNLTKMNPKELIEHGEEAEEFGGYFISNGIERVVRMLIMPRRNMALCMERNSWKKRGELFSEFGVSMRCVTSDQTAVNMVLHYLLDGSACLCLFHRREVFILPVVIIMKALVDVVDHHIFSELVKGKENDSFYKRCIAAMIRKSQDSGAAYRVDVLKYIGKNFRVKLSRPAWHTDAEVAEYLLQELICPHLSNNRDKFDCLVYMTRKLYAFAKHECSSESPDNPAYQEVLLAGHLYLMVLKDKMSGWLRMLRAIIMKKATLRRLESDSVQAALKSISQLTHPMQMLIATGNIVSTSDLGLMQHTGLTVVADKLNFTRYMSHFRCVHRGAFFAQMRTTGVRKLLPEAWGFLCPVHTPDGTPCGLMNHLAAAAKVVNTQPVTSHLPQLLVSLGMIPYNAPLGNYSHHYPVVLDGRMVGWLSHEQAPGFRDKLRYLKVTQQQKVPLMMEVVLVERTDCASQYPALYLFTTPARMMRPVLNLTTNTVEMIGTFEQVYMNICVVPEEAIDGRTTHQELSEMSMLSATATLIPYSNYNQSPRNMYQCQMGKQTMGTPLLAYEHRSDNKLYRILTPQSPLVRPKAYDVLKCDDYPAGTNAIVAVISYTGYDMEDAMIINKGAFERGFCHGMVYKTEKIDLAEVSRDRLCPYRFCNKPDDKNQGKLDGDGLPFIGQLLQAGDPYYSYVNLQTNEVTTRFYKHMEPAYVDRVRLVGSDAGTAPLTCVIVTLRVTRNPIIGDKFASRHGQKGICSRFWPVEDLPFTESGMFPDIIFNPHGFPSRMTIGMMIESMAGKSAAMHGLIHDATPFTFSEEDSAVDFMGRMLTAAGYNYYGTEVMYSGTDGREMEVQVFFGLVYYQRLRHMVADKFQVRSTGPVDSLTLQPVQGRKRAGGVRFGEMERDALLAHGTSFLLHDRLFNCSDRTTARVCTKCGSLLSPLIDVSSKDTEVAAGGGDKRRGRWTCHVCRRGDGIELISVPHVFKYLTAELASMNIKVTLDLE